MRTEEYIIILVGVVADQNQIRIVYTSTAPENHTSIRITYSNGKEINMIQHIKQAQNGVLTLPAQGLLPGTYTCDIALDNEVRDSKKFSIN